MFFMTPDVTLSNIVSKARLIRINNKWEEFMIVAKFETGTVENFGRILRNIPSLELLNSPSLEDHSVNGKIEFTLYY